MHKTTARPLLVRKAHKIAVQCMTGLSPDGTGARDAREYWDRAYSKGAKALRDEG